MSISGTEVEIKTWQEFRVKISYIHGNEEIRDRIYDALRQCRINRALNISDYEYQDPAQGFDWRVSVERKGVAQGRNESLNEVELVEKLEKKIIEILSRR